MNEELKTALPEEEEQKEQFEEEQIGSNPEDLEQGKEEYQEPSFEEVHEDVPDVIDEKNKVHEEITEEDGLEEGNIESHEKMLTQSQVNELVGRARQEGRMSAMKELLERYGVGDESELNDVFGRGQAYDGLNDDYTNVNHLYNEVMAENALLKTQIDMNRWEDVKLILGGKGLEVSQENIEAMLPSHPEWKSDSNNALGVGVETNTNEMNGGVEPSKPQPSILQKLGEDVSPQSEDLTEEEQVRKWYGI